MGDTLSTGFPPIAAREHRRTMAHHFLHGRRENDAGGAIKIDRKETNERGRWQRPSSVAPNNETMFERNRPWVSKHQKGRALYR